MSAERGAGPEHAREPDENPYRAPSVEVELPAAPPADGVRDGPPWERKGPAFDRFVATTRGVLGSPTRLFDRMRLTGGHWPPLTYGWIGGMVGACASLVYQIVFMAILESIDEQAMGENPFEQLFVVVIFLVVIPLAIVAGMYFLAILYHAGLWALGSARRPFEATFRTVAYVQGATGLLAVIPIFGGTIQFVWGIVAAIIGLSRAHGISAGRATAAVLLPFVVLVAFCCLVPVALSFLVLSTSAGGG